MASCSIQEENIKAPVPDDIIFYASFEQPSKGTRVYANENLYLRWTADDRVSIFNKLTYNQEYKFPGETGANSGGFKKVDGDEFITGNSIPHIVSVYPYLESTCISEDEVLTVTFPAEQHYAENTFGLGANTMVSVSENNVLQYKNVVGYLILKLYGEGISVSSITLKGNNGEKLAGKASVTIPLDGVPTATMKDDAITEITLSCDSAIQLGATAEESTQFWFAVPPVEFKDGFTVIVSGPFCYLEQSTGKDLTIERNRVSKMSPIEVEFSTEKSCIVYTSSDGNIVSPYEDAFDSRIVSNDYVDGYGIITFGGELTSIGKSAFYGCSNLTSIILPDGVTSIGRFAFSGCSSLGSISIPNSVTDIWDSAFSGCTSLMDISIPKSVTNIRDFTFEDCMSLPDIPIMEAVTHIGNYSFSGCIGLANITIPNGVKTIGDGAFGGCTGLSNIVIPNSVESVGNAVFENCTELISVTIRKGTSIGDFAFSGCTSLTTIPDGVTNIGEGLFYGCTSLTDVAIPNGAMYIGNDAFSGCTSLINVVIPESVACIGSNAFLNCTSLTNVTIPNGVTEIGEQAFKECRGLTCIIVLPETPPSGGKDMFFGTNDCPIFVPANSVETYRVLTERWCDYADRIFAIGSPVAVNMGLSVKWASFNLGATKPEDYGDYYAWGETVPKSLYTWENYKFTESGNTWDNVTFNKYNVQSSLGAVDNKTILDLEDDAASANWKGEWRMPTYDEWNELRYNSSWEWVIDYNGTGVSGYLVTSNITNYTNRFIFLPAAGLRDDYDLRGDGDSVLYWSSSLWTEYSTAAWGGSLVFVSIQGFDLLGENFSSDRYLGFPIRPVSE